MARLTEPQERLLMDIDRSLYKEIWCKGPRWRTAGHLYRAGLVSVHGGQLVQLTAAGKERVAEIKREQGV